MGDYNRKIKRSSWGEGLQVQVPVYGNVEIEMGDLLFLDRVDGLRSRGTSTATWGAFPLSKISGTTLTLASNRTLAATYFLGVAAWHSDSGVTEELSVHIDGLFNYPLKGARHVKPLYRVIPCGSGVTLYNQKVAVDNSSGDYIGTVAEYGTFKSSVEFVVTSILKPSFMG